MKPPAAAATMLLSLSKMSMRVAMAMFASLVLLLPEHSSFAAAAHQNAADATAAIATASTSAEMTPSSSSSSSSTTVHSEHVRIGTIEMQMRSRSTSSQNAFLFQVLSQTGHFLDEILTEEYANTQYRFSHVMLSVDGIGIESPEDDKGGGPTDAYVFLEGTAVFEGGYAPLSSKEVYDVVDTAFQERDAFFLELLTGSKNPLLRDITFAIVDVIEYVEEEEEGVGERNKGEGSFQTGIDGGTYPVGSTSASQDSPENTSDGTSGGRSNGGLEVWMIAVIAAAATCLLLALAFLIWTCPVRSRHRRSGSDPASSASSSSRQEPPTQKPSSQTSHTDGESRSHKSDVENA